MEKITFGKHKGTEFKEIPAGYLIWLYDNGIAKGTLYDFIKRNKTVLRARAFEASTYFNDKRNHRGLSMDEIAEYGMECGINGY